MMATLMAELVRARTLLLALIAAGFEVPFRIALNNGSGINGWDIVYPAVIDPHFLIVCGGLWLIVVLWSNSEQVTAPNRLIRYGTRIKGLWLFLLDHVAQLIAAFIAVTLISIPFFLSAGFSFNWSQIARAGAESPGPLDIYSVAWAAQTFSSPLGALGCVVIFAIFGIVGTSISFAALCFTGHARLARWGLLGFYIWSAACVFGLASGIPALDTVNLFELPWSLAQGNPLVTLAIWVVMITAAVLISAPAYIRRVFTGFTRRSWALALAPFFAIIIALSIPGSTFSARWSTMFLGQADSLIGYVRIASFIYLIGSLSIVRFLDETSGHRAHVEIRFGSRGRWLRRNLFKATVITSIGILGLIGGAAVGLYISGTPWSSASDAGQVVQTAFGALLTVWIVTAIGLVSATIANTIYSWIWVVAICLIAGYSPLIPLGVFNVFALFSSSFSSQQIGMPVASFVWGSAVLITTLLLLVTITVWTKRSRFATMALQNGK